VPVEVVSRPKMALEALSGPSGATQDEKTPNRGNSGAVVDSGVVSGQQDFNSSGVVGTESSSEASVRGSAVEADDDFDPYAPDPYSLAPFDPFDLDYDHPPLPQQIANGDDFPLPDKFRDFRLDQWHGIIEIVEALDNSDIKAVFVSAPTGTGKSLIAATVPQILGKPFIYTCTTHVLQGQVVKEFDYAKVLKGRANYPTFDDPDLTAEDCTRGRKVPLPACPSCPGWSKGDSWGQAKADSGQLFDGEETVTGRHCHYCHPTSLCAYQMAKGDAAHARMAVLNTSYLLAETSTLFGSLFSGWDLVVIDEADTLESELMRFITLELSPSMRKRLRVGLPAKKTVGESWVSWVRDIVLPAIVVWLEENPVKTDLFGKPDSSAHRVRNSVIRLQKKLKEVIRPNPAWEPPDDFNPDEEEPPADLAQGWVYMGEEKADGKSDKLPENVTVTFKPITVRNHAREVLWDKNKQFVLMSATIISPEQMAYDLGLEDGEWAVVEIPSSFPKERRPVVVRAEIEVTRNTEEQAYPIVTGQLIDIMNQHYDERILVHSNSYKLTRELFFEGRQKADNGYQRMITYLNAGERQSAINRYLDSPNSVLIAPSLDRGVDLHGDDCRVVVIAKIPYPYLGDKQVSARLYSTGRSGKTWYAVETIRSIVQMTGRGMRSKDDWCRAYILDKQFLTLYHQNQPLFPSWWREAVVFDENDPKWRDVLLNLGIA